MKARTKKNEENPFAGDRYSKTKQFGGIGGIDRALEMIKKNNPNVNVDAVADIIAEQINTGADTGEIVVPADPYDPQLRQTAIARIDAETASGIKELLKETTPTDEIIVSKDMLLRLSDFWKNPKENNPDTGEYVPADIFWAGTIPIKDCIIKNPEYGHIRLKSHQETVVYARIALFMDPVMSKGHVCGIVIIHYSNGNEYFTTFGLGNDEDDPEVMNKLVISQAIGIISAESTIHKTAFYTNNYFFNMSAEGLFLTMFSYLKAWYGLQIALLNPYIKFVFVENSSNSVYEIPSKKKPSKGSKKRPVPKLKYIKKYVITDAVFDNAIKRSYVHTKTSWYVTGHWRWQATKDGHKRIFIKGYWKGVARNTKHTEMRERMIYSENNCDNPEEVDNNE